MRNSLYALSGCIWLVLGLYVYVEYSHGSRLDADLIIDLMIDFIQDSKIDLMQDLISDLIMDLTDDLFFD
jgi:hypothetical protein